MSKPEKTLELHVDIDAPIVAAWKALTEGPGLANWFAPVGEVSAPGLGATVKTGWSEEMMMTGKVDAWEPLKHVRWLDESGWMGSGTSMAVDYYLTTEKGKTRVRLVQSAFGASEGWDDLFDGTAIGWTYFLYNLRVYLETHQGRTRRMISERLESTMPRAALWRHLLGNPKGLVAAGPAEPKPGDRMQLRIGEGVPVGAVVEIVFDQRALGIRIPDFGDALLFVEFEGKGDPFHVGYWLSVYHPQQAARVETGARRAFKRVHQPIAKDARVPAV